MSMLNPSASNTTADIGPNDCVVTEPSLPARKGIILHLEASQAQSNWPIILSRDALPPRPYVSTCERDSVSQSPLRRVGLAAPRE